MGFNILEVAETERHPFVPKPRNINEAGLTHESIANLACKHLHVSGVADLHQLSATIALSDTILETVLGTLRKANKLEILAATQASKGTRYSLTNKGRNEAFALLAKSGYTGPVPFPIEQYRRVVNAQSVKNCPITCHAVHTAFNDTIVSSQHLGHAINSSRAIIIYGLPGTGKPFIYKRLTRLLNKSTWRPGLYMLKNL